MNVQNSARAQALSGSSVADGTRPRVKLSDLHRLQFGEFNRPELWIDVGRNKLLVTLECLGCEVTLYSRKPTIQIL
jgi:hypothetical protein